MNKLRKKLFYAYRKIPLLIETLFDKFFLDPDVPMAKIVTRIKVNAPDLILVHCKIFESSISGKSGTVYNYCWF